METTGLPTKVRSATKLKVHSICGGSRQLLNQSKKAKFDMWRILGGILLVVLGVWLLADSIKETRRGYRSNYGNDLGLYAGSIIIIMIGISLILSTIC